MRGRAGGVDLNLKTIQMNWTYRMDGSKGKEVITPVGQQCLLFWWASTLGGAAGEGNACVVVGGGGRNRGGCELNIPPAC